MLQSSESYLFVKSQVEVGCKMDDLLKQLEAYSLDQTSRKTTKLLSNVEYRRLNLLLLKEILIELKRLNSKIT